MAKNKRAPLYPKARGKVYCKKGTWFYYVQDRYGKIVLADNTNDFRLILDTALRDVAAVRQVEAAGHKIRHSYRRLVDKAAGL